MPAPPSTLTAIDRAPPLPDGVSLTAWERIGAKRDGAAWAIPERDSQGEIIGWSLRLDDGGKSFRPGGHRGLTLAWPLGAYDGTSRDDPLFIVEGASDVAAGLGLALSIVGRPSATGGVQHLAKLGKGLHLCLIAENDAAGTDGAHRVAEQLVGVAASVRIIRPPDGVKDLRAWITEQGAQRDDILDAARNASDFNAPGSDTEPATPGFVPFPLSVFPPDLARYIETGAESKGVDPAMVAVPMLAAIAGTVGDTLSVRLKSDWSEPCAVWALVVCRSGVVKSGSVDLAIRFCKEREQASMRRYESARAEYDREKELRKRGKSDDETDLIEPVAVRHLVQDFTVESLAPLFARNPRGLLIARDEFSGVLAGLNAYKPGGKGSDEAALMEMHRGGTMLVDRATKGTVYAARALASVTGTIQPGILGGMLTTGRRESGLASRFLFAQPPRLPRVWTDTEVDPDSERVVARMFHLLFGLNQDEAPEGGTRAKSVSLTPEARELWVSYFNAHGREQAKLTDDDLDSAYSKLEGGAARLALVIHAARWAAGGDDAPALLTLDADSMRAGIDLAHWFKNEAKRMYARMGAPDLDPQQAKALELARRSGEITASECVQASKAAFPKAEDADRALRALAEAGRGTYEHRPMGPSGGRPGRVFRPC